MVDYTWPADVPQRMLRSGFEYEPGDPVERTPTDSGLARQRRMQTAMPERFSGPIRMTRAQMLAFTDWRNAVGGAVITRNHPLTGDAGVSCRFVAGEQGPPRPDPATPKWLVPVVLEVLP